MPADPMDPDQFMAQRRQQEAPKPMDPDEFMARRGTPAPSRGGRGGGATGQSSPEASKVKGNALTDLIGGVMDTTVKTIPAAAKLVYHAGQALTGYDAKPIINDAKDIAKSHGRQFKKAAEASQRGDNVEAWGHGLAAMLPVVGPAAADAGETIGGELEYGDEQHPERATGVVREPQVARGIGQGIGLAASASPKNIMEPVVTGAAKAVGKIPVPERLTPEGMYQSSLRPGLARKNLPKIDAKVQTGLREGIPVSRGGLENTKATIDGLNTDIAAKIQAQSQAQGPVVDPAVVAQNVDPLRQTFGNQVNPKADLAALAKSSGEFTEKHTTPLPQGVQGPTKPDLMTLSDAQSEKQGTYRQLRKKYGELGSADVEAQKALARGLKDEIAKRVPEISGLNAREGALIELQTELEKMVAREGNKNLLGLVPATMSHNPFGFLATLAMDNPAIKSRIAILLDRARGATSASGIGKAAAATAPAAIPAKAAELGEPASPEDIDGLASEFQKRRVRFPDLRGPGQVR